MRTLKESILSPGLDIGLEALGEIPMSSLAHVLEGYGRKQLLKKILREIGTESCFDMVWSALQDCGMSYAPINKLTDYEKEAIEYLAKQNPVDPKIVMDVVQRELYDRLYEEADVNGYSTNHEKEIYADGQVWVFLHPIYKKRYYENMLEFYFFIENREAGWISIRKDAKEENIDLLRYILR